MSTVTEIRDTILPRIDQHLRIIRQCAIASNRQLIYGITHGTPWLSYGPIRCHLIQLHISVELLLKELRLIYRACDSDPALDVLICQSKIMHHRPTRVDYQQWGEYVAIIHIALEEGSVASSTFMAAFTAAYMVRSMANSLLSEANVLTLRQTNDLEGGVRLLQDLVDLIAELFDALDTEVTLH